MSTRSLLLHQRLRRWSTGGGGLLVALTAAVGASAADLDVPGDFATIQAAIDAAVAGDEVVVAPGTYVERLNTAGKAITVRSTDPSDPSVVAATVLDAGGAGSAIRIVSGERYDTVIDGLTITGGSASLGGGLEIALSDPTIRRCVITGNQAGKGGGAYLYVSAALFDRCRFEANDAEEGGAVHAYAVSSLRFDGCTFVDNTAQAGAAIRARTASVRVLDSVIRDNVAAGDGGAYAGSGAEIEVVSSLVAGNRAASGAAFHVIDDGVHARNATIVGNVATGTNVGSVGSGFQTQLIFDNSIVRENGPQPFDGWLTPLGRFSNIEGGAAGDGNIDADPLFVDPGKGDYRLAAGSPSEDAGADGRTASFDLRDLGGTPRIQGDAVDQGAYERDGAFTPPAPKPGRLAVTVKDDGALANGVPQPLYLLDLEESTWSVLVRDLPAFAFTADDERECFWVQAGDSGLLGRVPYDTLELEEIGRLRFDDAPGPSVSLSGMAVRDGVLYATTAFGSGERLLVIDPDAARVTGLAEIPAEYAPWDLHYDAANDRLLLLSSVGSLPSDQLGVVEIDLETFELETIQQWVNDDPAQEAPALQGLATGADRHFLWRPLYNDLEVYDATTLEQTQALSVPGGTAVLGGLTWVEGLAGDPPMPGDADADGSVGMDDLLTVLANLGRTDDDVAWSDGDFDGDGDVDLQDLLVVLAHFDVG